MKSIPTEKNIYYLPLFLAYELDQLGSTSPRLYFLVNGKAY
jgi:hypothetical protein